MIFDNFITPGKDQRFCGNVSIIVNNLFVVYLLSNILHHAVRNDKELFFSGRLSHTFTIVVVIPNV